MKKKNNKGITLVELLVALAVGSIVISAVIILLRQGIAGYTRQTITTQLQDDANITLNQMSDTIMQAKCIDIYNEESGEKNTPKFITNRGENGNAASGNAYSFDIRNHILYVGTPQTNNDYTKLSILCKNVWYFKVQILNTSVKIEGNGVETDGRNKYKITVINNPVQIKVTLILKYEYGDSYITREVSRVTALRNKIKINDPNLPLAIQGTSITDFSIKSALDAYFTD